MRPLIVVPCRIHADNVNEPIYNSTFKTGLSCRFQSTLTGLLACFKLHYHNGVNKRSPVQKNVQRVIKPSLNH